MDNITFASFPEPYKSIRNYVNKSIIILVVFAIFGNILIIKVMLRKENRNSSTSIFFMALAVSDLVIAVFNSLLRWLTWMFTFNLNSIGPHLLTGLSAFHYSNIPISTWILVCITSERLTSIIMPHRFKTLFTKRRAFMIVLIVCVVILSLYTIQFCLFVKVVPGKTFSSMELAERIENGKILLFVIDSMIAFFLPVIIIVFSSIYITVQLHRNFKKNSSITNDRNRSVTMTLLAANIVFVLTTSPFVFLQFINNEVDMSPFLFLTMFDIFIFLADMNSAVNFYVYVLSGSKFRSDVKQIFGYQERQSSSERSS